MNASAVQRMPRREMVATQPHIFRKIMDTEEQELWNSRDQLLAQDRPSELVFDPAEHGVNASWSKP